MAHKLITKEIRTALLANWNNLPNNDDPVPVCKFFTPAAACTWLVCEMDADDEDQLFGLADLGLGFPETGWFSLREISQPVASPTTVNGQPFKMAPLPLERDLYWDAKGIPLSRWAARARELSRIPDVSEIVRGNR